MPIRVEPKRKRRKGRGGPQRGMEPKNPRERLEELNPRPAPKAPQDPRGRPTVPDRIKERFKKFNPLFPGMSGLPTSRLTGGQIKIAAKAPPRNKIDGKDFAVLKAEKAKGRGMGLQDEKLKPGKVTKAFAGALAVGLSAKNRMTGGDKKKRAPVGMGGIGASMIKAEAMKKILGRNKGGMGKVMKANSGDMVNKKNFRGFSKVFEGPQDKGRVATISGKKPSLRANSKAAKAARFALKSAKATRIGKIVLGVAAAGLGAKEYLKRKMKKNEKKPQKKMGGGMMMRPNPVGYKKGVLVKVKLGRNKPTKLY